MPSITPDFTEAVEASNDGPMPEGEYTVRVSGVENKVSQAGNPYLNWKLTVFGMEGDLSRYNNWPIFHRTMLTGKGSGILKSFLKATAPDYDGGELDTDDILGAEVAVTIKHKVDTDGSISRWPDVKGVRALA